MKKYFIHIDGEQKGPFSIEDLKSIEITRDTPVWHEGMEDWTKVSEVEELKELTMTVPPQFSDTSNKSENPPGLKLESENKKGNGSVVMTGILIGLIIIAAAGTGFYFYVNKNYDSEPIEESYERETYQEKVMTIEEIERSQPLNFLSTDGTYRKTLLGNKFKLKCKIINNATVASYKDAILRVTYYSKTKTVLTTNDYTIYEVFPPTSSVTVDLKIDNYKNVESIDWNIVRAASY